MAHTGQEVKMLNQGVLVWGGAKKGGEEEGERRGEVGNNRREERRDVRKDKEEEEVGRRERKRREWGGRGMKEVTYEGQHQATLHEEQASRANNCSPLLFSAGARTMSQCTRAPGGISWGAGWVSRTPGTAKTHTKQYHSALSRENTDQYTLSQEVSI